MTTTFPRPSIAIRYTATLALLLISSLASAQTSTVPSSAEQARSMTLDVIRTAADLRLALDQHAHGLRAGGDGSSALTTATVEAARLDSQSLRLEGLVHDLDVEQEALTRAVLAQVERRLDQLEDVLVLAIDPGAQASVEWCDGAINCLFLKSSCTGCFIKYDGYFDDLPTEGGCFDPCPY